VLAAYCVLRLLCPVSRWAPNPKHHRVRHSTHFIKSTMLSRDDPLSAQSPSNFVNETDSASAILAMTKRLGFRFPRSIPPI
jgi:hypothetical protein